MKIIYITTLLLFCTFFTKAQNTFSKLYSLSDSTDWLFTNVERVLIENDTILAYGDAVVITSDSTTKQGIFVYRIDSLGNVIDYVIHFDTLGEPLVVDETYCNIIATSEGGFAALGATGVRESFIFFKLNKDLSIEFRKEYPDTVNSSNFRHNIVEVKGGYIIWGQVQKPDIHHEIRIKYIDYSGEIIWEEKIQRAISTVIIDFEKLNDSLFLMVVGHGDGIGNLIRYTIEEFGLNQEFEIKWSSSRSEELHVQSIHKLPSNDFLISGSEEIGKIFHNTIYSRVLIKLGIDFREKEKLNFGHPVTWIDLNPELRDFLNIGENIYGTGASLHPVDDINNGLGVGVLYNFSSSLDSLWLRNHRPDFQPYEGFGNFLTVDTLSSGNLILAGAATNLLERKDFGWIVKTLPNGCLSPEKCDFTSTISNVKDLIEGEEIALYPNPADDNLTVQLPEDYGRATIQVYELTGQLLYEAKAERQHQFSTQSMNSGIYFLKILAKEKEATVHKFKVVH